MSADATPELSFTQRVTVLILVMLGTTIYAASMLISSALLPQIQGSLSATQDEISWTVTFNILATAIATPTTGWLANQFGRRNTMKWCAILFTISTFMCGMASSLTDLILWRIIQGAAGAPLVPLGQTILMDAFPKRQHNMVIAIFGMANMLGPMAGPTLGGQISEAFGWRWGFWMIVPVAAIASLGFAFLLPPTGTRQPAKLDWTGFLTLSLAVGGIQLVLSRGQRLDWFDSMEIVAVTFLAGIALYMFIAHSLTAKQPFIRLALLRDRNYALGLLMVTLFGMLNFATIVLLPPLLQQQAGYPDSAIGIFIGWRGFGSLMGFFLAMLVGWVDPRIVMIVGAILQASTGMWLLDINLDVTEQFLAVTSFAQGVSIGLAWVPMTVISFWTLKPEYRAEGMAMFHLMRNFGSSLFISVAVTEIVRTTASNYARMTEVVSPFNRAWDLPWVTGAWSIETAAGLARFAREIVRQATVIGYSNAFVLYIVAALAAIPLCLMARLPKQAQ